MKYIVDLITRYNSAFGFVSDTAVGELEGLLNGGIFKAGIAYNEGKWNKADNPAGKYNAELYPQPDWSFVEMVMKYEGKELNFSIGSLNGETEGIFAPPPLMRFRRTKNISVTVVDGGDEAEIVENFGVNSWDIELNGVLVDMDGHTYPGDKVKRLSEFFAINDVIDVACPLLLDMGIKSIYFKEQSFEPVEGFPDTVKYSLIAKSIKPALFSLILKS